MHRRQLAPSLGCRRRARALAQRERRAHARGVLLTGARPGRTPRFTGISRWVPVTQTGAWVASCPLVLHRTISSVYSSAEPSHRVTCGHSQGGLIIAGELANDLQPFETVSVIVAPGGAVPLGSSLMTVPIGWSLPASIRATSKPALCSSAAACSNGSPTTPGTCT